jgi:hypothetical protein
MPLPVPVLPEMMRTQPQPLVAVQLQSLEDTVTLTLPSSVFGPCERLVGEMEKLPEPADWLTMND